MNAYENHKGAYESTMGTDDAYKDTHHPTSKYTNHNETPDDDRFWSLMRYQLSLTKNTWALTVLTILTPIVLIHTVTLCNADERHLLNPYDRLRRK